MPIPFTEIALTLGGGLLSLFGGREEERSSEDIYEDAIKRINENYENVIGRVLSANKEAIDNLKSMYPRLADQIGQAYDIEENEYFKQLKSNLDIQKEQMIDRLTRQKQRGRRQFMATIGRMGVQGARSASQLRQMDIDFQKSLGETILQQDVAKNQMMANLLNQFALGEAQARTALTGQEATQLGGAYLMPEQAQLALGRDLLGAQAGLAGALAGQEIKEQQEPTGLQALGRAGTQLGGALIGRRLGYKEPVKFTF